MATLLDYVGITKLRDAWPKWKANVIAVNNQVINHVAGTADKHAAQDTTYSGGFTSMADVKAALDQAKTEIDAIVVNASIDPEVAVARISSVKGETFATLDARLEESEQDLMSYQAETTKRTGHEVSVLEFGADPTGLTLSTQAFLDADIYCVANKTNMIIPDGSFWINGKIPFPDHYAIKGNGYQSNIVVELPDGESIWKEAITVMQGWGFEGLRFSLKTGSSKNVGGIYLESSMRGAYIKNIWSYDLRRPLYLGDGVWGVVAVENIFFYLLGENLDPSIITAAFLAKGNTIMMSNIEILGGWNKGLHLDGVGVFKLNGYNIGGSTTTYQMLESVYVENSNSGEIKDGWVEQLLDTPTSANGRTVWANGEGHAIYIKGSEGIEIANSNLSSGSIYIDNSTVTVDQVKYEQVNAGIKVLNNGRVNATEDALGNQNLNINRAICDGEIVLNTRTTHCVGILDNPILKIGLPHVLAVTNGALVTLADEITDFVSGDRAIKVTITASFQGVNINKTNLKIGKLYTLNLKIKSISGLSEVYLSTSTGSAISPKYPATLKRTGEVTYHTLICPFIATATTATLKLQGALNDVAGVFLLDSCDIFEGYNVFDTSQYNKYILNDQGRLKNTVAPTSGAWEVRDKVAIITPIAGGYLEQVCVTAGTPGVWKGVGVIQA